MKHKLLASKISIAFILVAAVVHAQNEPISIPSPEMAAFAKNGNVPVSLYTGVPEISIPLFTIEDGDISLPITISYNASGIKVEEEASWIGLGWNLNAGGQITRAIRGQDDYGPAWAPYWNSFTLSRKPMYGEGQPGEGLWYTRRYFETLGLPGSDIPPLTAMNVNVKSGVHNFNQYSGGDDYGRLFEYDFVSDMFYFTAGNSSGKFVVNDDGVPMLLNYSKVKVEQLNFTDFKITGEDGLIYTYTKREQTTTMGQGPAYSHNLSWYLTRIESANGKNVVDFIYEGGSMTTNPTTSTKISVPANGQETYTSATTYNQILYWYLSEIHYNGGIVKFNSEADRADLAGARRLSSVSMTNNEGTEVKKYTFNTTYFHATNGQANDALNTDRLRLDKIYINDDQNNAYVFDYNTDQIPSKTSGKDHWGYFNNTGFDIPRGIYQKTVNSIKHLAYRQGGDYDAHWPQTQAMILKQITYPTKGYSKFNYEPNKFSNIPDYWKLELVPSSIPIMDYPLGKVDNGYVEVNSFLGDLTGHFWCPDPSVLTMFNISFYNFSDNQLIARYTLEDWENAPNGNHFYLTKRDVELNGHFKCVVETDRTNNNVVSNADFFQFFNLQINRAEYDLVNTGVTEMEGAGLRLREIINHDGIKETTFKQYEYTNDDGISTSGLIMNYPVYMDFETFSENHNMNSVSNLYSRSNIGLSTSAQGNFVGYSRVKEIIGRDTLNTGSTVYYYTNSPDILPFEYGLDLPTLQHDQNGLLSKKINYDVNNNKLTQLINTYNPFNQAWPSTTWARFIGYGSLGNTGTDVILCTTLEYQLNYKLLNQTETQFINNLPSLSAETEYQYLNNPSPRKIIKTTSLGYKNTTEYRYPDDFTQSGVPLFISEMKNYNIINKPVEVVTLKTASPTDSKAIAGVISEYGTGPQKGLIVKQYNLTTDVPLAWSDANFSSVLSSTSFSFNSRYVLEKSYDYLNQHGKLTDYKIKGDFNVSYKWGHDDQYPIAECKNSLSSEFLYEGFEESTASGVSIGASHTGTKFTTNPSVSWTKPNSRSYVISYWYFDSGSSAWKYSGELSYTANTFTLTGGNAFDDIRIYPKDASMTTYFYAPLIGLKSSTDNNGQMIYYEYDNEQRLKTIQDHNRNIVKRYDYNYKY